MATLLMRPAEGGSGDKKRRARKGKNAQKKQPQRGLGVAQLEKLRLQEQSLLCPSPSYSLRLCSPANHNTMARCDSDVSQTILSLANGQAVGVGSNLLREEAPGLSRLALSCHSSTHNFPQPAIVPGNNVETADSKRGAASRSIACLSQSSKFCPANTSFFSNVLSSQLQMLDNNPQHTQGLKVEGRRAGETENAPVYVFSTINNRKEGAGSHVHDAGFLLHPVFKDVQGIPLSLSDQQCLETLIGGDATHLPRKRIELPVVPVVTSPSFDNKTNVAKELSSFQSSPTQHAWSTPDKVAGRKRPWLALQENARHMATGNAQALDLNLNAPAGDNEDRQISRLNQVSENQIGAHYTTGIIRTALGNSCLPLGKIKLCSSVPWQDGESPSTIGGYFSDRSLENGTVSRQCPSQSSVKDSCSSATGSSTYLSMDRKRCVDDPKILEKESICSNFLSLGLSSSSYPANACNESEESTQDNNSLMSTVNDISRWRQGYCAGDDALGLQHRTSACKRQEVGVDLEGSHCFSMQDYGGNKRKSSMLLSFESNYAIPSHQFNRLSPSQMPFMATNTSPKSGTACSDQSRVVEDILDLRLKLAL